MKLKIMILGFIASSLLANCGGKKNETQVDGNMVLAVRSLEDTNEVAEEERTQVAILSGDLSSPEKAQIAAENARWVPVSQFSQDDELAFDSVQQAQKINDSLERVRGGQNNGQNNGGFGNGNNGGGQNNNGHGNNGGQNNNDHGNNGGQNNNDHGNNGQWNGGNGGQNNGGHTSNDHRDRNWRPYHGNQQSWNNRYTPRATFQYWGYNQCNNSYIYNSGNCYRPYSPYYGNYYWQPRYYYYVNIVYRGYNHNRYNWRGRAHIRFYW
jgi:hypothetical protein